MSANKSNPAYLVGKINPNDQSVFIAFNIEDDSILLKNASARVFLLQFIN